MRKQMTYTIRNKLSTHATCIIVDNFNHLSFIFKLYLTYYHRHLDEARTSEETSFRTCIHKTIQVLRFTLQKYYENKLQYKINFNIKF